MNAEAHGLPSDVVIGCKAHQQHSQLLDFLHDEQHMIYVRV